MSAAPEPIATGVIAALDFEARSAQALKQRGWQVQVSGMGPACARQAAEHMLAAGVRRVLVWGTAGGLDPELQAGTLFLPDLVFDARSGARHEVSANLHAQLEQALAQLDVPLVRRGSLVTTEQPLMAPREKAQAARETGALMVDMEAAVVAQAATRAGAEFAVIRALVDAANVALPPVVLAAVNTPHPHRRVLTGLLKRPQDLPAVLRLGRSFQRAHHSLAAAAEALAASNRK